MLDILKLFFPLCGPVFALTDLHSVKRYLANVGDLDHVMGAPEREDSQTPHTKVPKKPYLLSFQSLGSWDMLLSFQKCPFIYICFFYLQ